MRILLCTDGSAFAERALNFGAELALAAGGVVTLLGVSRPGAAALLRTRAALAQAQTRLPVRAVERVRTGRPAEEIIAEAASGGYDLIVTASRGRTGLARLLFGSVASRLARYAPVPVIIVKAPVSGAVRKILACTSGDERGERAARWGGRLARWLQADVTILHVLSQLGLAPDARVEELGETAEQAIASGTREGLHLRREMELTREQGAAGKVVPQLRNGLVLDEIVAEVKEGDYDLVVIGAHEPPEPRESFAGLRAYVLDDVADQIISAVQKPVLVVRGR
jgi:nucleotide-binding universal stress UspA family protein